MLTYILNLSGATRAGHLTSQGNKIVSDVFRLLSPID
jgi:hypothetical protein